MNVEEACLLAQRLLSEHGLPDWRFRFDRAKRRFGCCWPTRKLITLSRPLTELNDLAKVRDTILHEIAHALVPGGHSAAWRRMCVRIGAEPRRCFDRRMVNLPETGNGRHYVAICRCAIQHVKRRKPTRTYICRRCKRQLEWSSQHVFA